MGPKRTRAFSIKRGLFPLTNRPLRKGDLIEAHWQLATVEMVGFRSTRLNRLDNTIMIVPNSQLSDQVVINWELRARRRANISIGVTFDAPREALEAFQSALRARSRMSTRPRFMLV